MFINAIEEISKFTRPVLTVTRQYDGTLTPGASTLFFVNDEGVAITCRHVADFLVQADSINNLYNQFKAEKAAIPSGKKARGQLQSLESKYKYKKNTIVEVLIQDLDVGDITGITWHFHQNLDLTIITFNGLPNKLY